ncbi:phosphoethanolamine--lipid A transferase [Shewanella sp. JM162201]|uniref:Phosphoethanolamine--lipid A transferase n=1 Tax=Shewanella jiangmenensis TaxID=2837387 RepID=A0ABS5V6L1_9GAMM|nr:phosphoethanolamine--lipid A transferase [Shewanella jiangmenensis]MBT1445466.1 phosphoethanolamine--lipid A transferase [Shewanella jiangmenensis]
MSLNKFTFFVALYFGLVLNFPLYLRAKQGFDALSDINWLFVAALPVLLVCLLALIFSLFSVKYVVKPFFMLLTLISAAVVFAMYRYGIVFDRAMMENIFETNSAEASMYFNLESVIGLALLGGLPAVLIYKADIEYRSIWRELGHKLGFMLAMLLGAGAIMAVYYQDLVSFGRNNDDMKQLIVPTYYIGAAAKYVNQRYLETPLEYQQLGLDATQALTDTNQKPTFTVLIVGETARSMNYEYYGYGRDTNAHSKGYQPIVLKDVESCGTATAQSLPCMFSRMDRDNYDSARAYAQDSVMDVLSHAGVELLWLDNDSGCKGVCDRIPNETINLNADPALCSGTSCFDEILLARLDEILSKPIRKNTLIVLHVMGSHGPTYFERYPEAHKAYVPDCPRSDIQNCSNEALVNTYDNTIRYTDYIMASVIEKLSAINDKADTAMMYISDHGESLGEKGLYLHGAPYALAPKEQISVPWLVWLSASFADENRINSDCLQNINGPLSHDNLFDSLLGLMQVKTEVYREAQDIFAACRR